MSGPDCGIDNHPKRGQTDSSLRLERDKADTGIDRLRRIEEEADEIMRLARERADSIVEVARADAALKRAPESPDRVASVQREQARADDNLEHERADADATLENERNERRRYLADFLAVERGATDKGLTEERELADTVIAARDEFLAIVSHDLRTLLGGLSFNAELLLRNAEDSGKVRRQAQASQRLVARMNRMVNDLLDIASIDAGKLGVHLENAEVCSLLLDTLEAFEPIAANKDVNLTASVPAKEMWASVDSGRILQVLANLVSNATEPGGRVSLGLSVRGTDLTFTVRDTGSGIPSDFLETVFQRHRQVHRDRRGLGLGLYISKCIIEGHGGRIWVQSEPHVGSSFHFNLPLTH